MFYAQKKIYNDINLGILRLGLRNKKILDVGCGTGLLGVELKKAGNKVYGIDISEEELSAAAARLDGVEKLNVITEVSSLANDFDVLIFADILEHLPNPEETLKKFLPKLKSEGLVVASIPNVACYNMRFSLLGGHFNYTDYGILDSTHLRFFTRKTAKEFIQGAGLDILKVEVTPFFVRSLFRLYRSISGNAGAKGILDNLLHSGAFKIYRKWMFPLEHFIASLWPTLLAYQFIIIARKS